MGAPAARSRRQLSPTAEGAPFRSGMPSRRDTFPRCRRGKAFKDDVEQQGMLTSCKGDSKRGVWTRRRKEPQGGGKGLAAEATRDAMFGDDTHIITSSSN